MQQAPLAPLTPPTLTLHRPDQVIMLLLGGFAIAAALSKHFIAKQLAVAILSRVGRRPRDVLLANMLVATFASMWISNVAAPVLCFSLVQVGCPSSLCMGARFGREIHDGRGRACDCVGGALSCSGVGAAVRVLCCHPLLHSHPDQRALHHHPCPPRRPPCRSRSCAPCRRPTPSPKPWSSASPWPQTWVRHMRRRRPQA